MFSQWKKSSEMPAHKKDERLTYTPLMSNGQPWPEVKVDLRHEGADRVYGTITANGQSAEFKGEKGRDIVSTKPYRLGPYTLTVSQDELAARAMTLFPKENPLNATAFLMQRVKETFIGDKKDLVVEFYTRCRTNQPTQEMN